MPMNKPTPFNMPPTFSDANKPQWLVLGDDDCIVKQNKIIAVSSDSRCVTLHLDNRSVVTYNALSTEKAKQEVSEIINILLQRNVNEES